ncbi:MAG: hypothetical protein ACRC6I_11880, partial [Paracoccaceae bacterium]
MASELGYRVYRLRRLIGVCLGLVGFGVALGMWLVPGANALQFVAGVGLFSLLAVAQLGMILFWPTDMSGPLCYAVGAVPLMAAGLPLGAAAVQANGDMVMVMVVMFGPLVWLVLTPLAGHVLLWPLDRIMRRNVQGGGSAWVPLDLAAAQALFGFRPDRTTALASYGPVGWDGFFEERLTRQVADEATGVISAQVVVTKLRMLESDAASQAVMAMVPGPGNGSLVIHRSFAQEGAGTRISQRFQADHIAASRMLTGWLA